MVKSQVKQVEEFIKSKGGYGASIEEVAKALDLDPLTVWTWIDLWGRIGKMKVVSFELPQTFQFIHFD